MNQNTQIAPAIVVATWLEKCIVDHALNHKAAAELRRLHAENESLRAAPSTSPVAEFVADDGLGTVRFLAHEGEPLTDGQKLFAIPQAAPSTSPAVVRVCPDKDSVCGDNSRYWCNSCPKHTTGAQELADSGELMEAAVEMRAAMAALKAENNQFRATLTIIGNWGGTTRFHGWGSYTDVARAALGEGGAR